VQTILQKNGLYRHRSLSWEKKRSRTSYSTSRFANLCLKPFWNNKYIDHVQISVAAERGSVWAHRGGYYSTAAEHFAGYDSESFVANYSAFIGMECPSAYQADRISRVPKRKSQSVRKFPKAKYLKKCCKGARHCRHSQWSVQARLQEGEMVIPRVYILKHFRIAANYLSIINAGKVVPFFLTSEASPYRSRFLFT
jgi:hypothetical protein